MKLLFIFTLLLMGCATPTRIEIVKKKLLEHPIRNPGFWKAKDSTNLMNKFYPEAPKEMVDFINLANESDDFPERAGLVQLSEKELKAIEAAINQIPEYIRKMIAKKLVGFMIVKDLGGSGMTDGIRDKNGDYKSGFMVFDYKVLTRKANDWCSWKESSPYQNDDGLRLRCIMANKENDNLANAFQYIFLHEAGHIVSIDSKKLPFWDVEIETKEDLEKYPFLGRSWEVENKKVQAKTSEGRYLNERVRHYYEKKTIPSKQMVRTYNMLSETKFPTMYATKNVWDDFAEVFVNYIHTQILRKPFSVNIYNRKKRILQYPNCWQEKRCEESKLGAWPVYS